MPSQDVRSPRVLHVLEAVRGGTSRHVVDVVRTATGVSHHVALPPPGTDASASGALVDSAVYGRLAAAGAEVHHVDMRRTPAHPANGRALLSLRQLRRRIGADVVHGHSAVGGALARATAVMSPAAAVYTPNGVPEGKGYLLIERALGPVTSAFVAVSESEADLARSARLARAERVHLIPNGIDLEPPSPDGTDLRARFGIPDGTPLVGTVARLVEQKAPEQFVAVCAAVARRRPDAHFVLIGMGPLQDEVDRGVAAGGLGDRWHQVPHLPTAAAVLGQLQCFVLPSRFEGGPYTPLEAIRAGVPVVLSDVVGNRDVAVHGESGLLYPFGDTDAMADGVSALLADPQMAASIAAAAGLRLRSHFDVVAAGARLSALYRDLAARSGATQDAQASAAGRGVLHEAT